MRLCSFEWCIRKHDGLGYCNLHYKRFIKWTDMHIYNRSMKRIINIYWDIIKIPLWNNAKDWYMICDASEYDKFIKLNKNRNLWKRWYPVSKELWKNITWHHFILWRTKKPYVIDHINWDKLDNRKANLRIVTQKENWINRKWLNKNNISWCRWVSFCRADKVRIAEIKLNYKSYKLWRYKNIEDAIEARKKWEEIYHSLKCND